MSKRITYIVLLSIVNIFNIYSLRAELNGQALLDSLMAKDVASNPRDTSKVVLWNNIAKAIYNSEPDEAILYCYRGVQLAKKINFKAGIAYCYNTLGLSYWCKSDFQKAKDYLYQALAINSQINREDEKAKNYGNLGIIYKAYGSDSLALENYFKALNIHEKYNTGKSAIALTNIGNLYVRSKSYDKAEKYLNLALKANKKSKIARTEALIFENLGDMYAQKKEYTRALFHFDSSIAICRSIGNKVMLADNYYGKAEVYSEMKKYDSAFANYYVAKEYNLELKRDAGLCENYDGLGTLYLMMAQDNNPQFKANRSINLKKAFDTLMIAANFAKQNTLLQDLVIIYSKLSTVSQLLKKWDNAFNYYKLSAELKDSVFGVDLKVKFAEMEANRDRLLQAKEIAYLNKANQMNQKLFLQLLLSVAVILVIILYFVIRQRRIIRQLNIRNAEYEEVNTQLLDQNQLISDSTVELEILNEDLKISKEKLAEANAGKDKFFSIISHDLRTPFTGFMGLADLLANEAENLNVKEIKQMGKSLLEAANNTFKLLNNLLDWAKLQSDTMPFELNDESPMVLINAAIDPLKNALTQKSISIKKDIEAGVMIRCDSNMITSVLRNIISNAIKFTPNYGEIEISMKKQEYNTAEFTIKDNGIGMPDSISEKLFHIEHHITASGTNNEKGSGLGLILCKEFIERHNGKIWVISEEGKGSTLYFSLPLF